MSSLDPFEDFIRDRVEKERWSHARISAVLKENYPECRGLSERSVLRFCLRKGIHKMPRINNEQLDKAVCRATEMVSAYNPTCQSYNIYQL